MQIPQNRIVRHGLSEFPHIKLNFCHNMRILKRKVKGTGILCCVKSAERLKIQSTRYRQFTHCLASGSNIAFACMHVCFFLSYFSLPPSLVCSAAREGICFEYVRTGVVITTLLTQFLHLASLPLACVMSVLLGCAVYVNSRF